MRRATTFIAALALAIVAGCATTTPAVGPAKPGRLGSGSLNAPYQETINLNAAGTFYSSARYIGSMDLVGADFYAASGAAACTPTVEISNRYNSATSSPTDDTLWNTYSPTGWTAPAAISGAVSNYYTEIPLFSPAYVRWKFVCSSGTTALLITWQMKGG